MFDLKQYIVNSGLSQKEFGARLGYTESYISRVINGQVPLNGKFISKCQAIFGELPQFSTVTQVDSEQFMEAAYLPISAQAGYLDSMESYNTTENLETMLIRMVLKTSGYILTSANNLSA